MNGIRVIIRGIGTVSPLADGFAAARREYDRGAPRFTQREFAGESAAVAPLCAAAEQLVSERMGGRRSVRELDRSAHLAAIAAAQAAANAGWSEAERIETGVFIGSSRGPTGRLEDLHRRFLDAPSDRLPPRTSPVTTLGSTASAAAHAIGSDGPAIGHSVTCSTGLHAIAHTCAWLRSGMLTRAVAGGAEAPLTPFTVAQMRALGIYTELTEEPACRPFEEPVRNTLALGEGASIFALEAIAGEPAPEGAIEIAGVGWGFEAAGSGTGISEEGAALARAMRGALRSAGLDTVDAVIAHAPGTYRGGESEYAAVRNVFAAEPLILSAKWLFGHTFGAAGTFAMEYACHLLLGGKPLPFPYRTSISFMERRLSRVMINAAGFGGNAMSVILQREAA